MRILAKCDSYVILNKNLCVEKSEDFQQGAVVNKHIFFQFIGVNRNQTHTRLDVIKLMC